MSTRDLPENLMELLSSGRLGRRQLASLVKKVSLIQKSGVRPIKVFPIGIPWPDGIVVETILEGNQLEKVNEILQLEGIRSLEIFPKGIPKPDIFFAKIGVE